MARRKHGPWRPIALSVVLVILVWVAGLFVFVDTIPQRTPNSGPTDAIVVLTGGPGRIDRGAELLSAGQAKQMLITGVDIDVRAAELRGVDNLPERLRQCCVTLGRYARDTHENAIETAAWVADRNIDTIRLVTADFHMPRSVLELERRLPGVTIVPEPVSAANIRTERWWLRPATASLLAIEYSKYLVIRAQNFLAQFAPA